MSTYNVEKHAKGLSSWNQFVERKETKDDRAN